MHPLGKLTHAQVPDAYRSADALLFPTRLEGFGYAAVEAMACALPVVATNSSSIPEIVQHGQTGHLCQQDDVAGFVSAVRALAADPQMWKRMGDAGRRRAVEHFQIDKMVSAYINVCEQLLH
jgi:glycosyltransferase involved in cell wall biosynthesis